MGWTFSLLMDALEFLTLNMLNNNLKFYYNLMYNELVMWQINPEWFPKIKLHIIYIYWKIPK